MRQRIAVNARFLIKGKLEGIGLFTYEALKRITTAQPDVDFYFLFDRAYDASFIFGKNVTPVVLFPQARHPFLWVWWFEVSVRNWLAQNKPDLFLSTDGFGCLGATVPQVLVMHDLAFVHFKNHTSFISRLYYNYFMPRFARKAARIATVSEFSKSDIMQQYAIDASKIDVVYNGAKEIYKPVTEPVKDKIKATYTSGKNYFVYVGSIHPRKNIENLLLAFEVFKKDTNSDYHLLIVGRKAWSFSAVEQIHAGMIYKHDVLFMGHIAPEELAEIMASAFAMVYVSLFEGFGIPILEAQSCGVPVITSNNTSMPEAAGGAALLVNATSVTEIAAAMKQLYENNDLRTKLIVKGNAQKGTFSWHNTADKLWSCCTKAIE